MKILKGIGFWLLSLTWGLPMTLVGILVALALLITGHKPYRFHYSIYFVVGKNWGGVNLGAFFVVCKASGLYTKQHEAGHGLQNIVFGVLMPFIVSIPSAIRYWYRRLVVKSGKKKATDLPSYYAIWFEAQASAWGEKHFKE